MIANYDFDGIVSPQELQTAEIGKKIQSLPLSRKIMAEFNFNPNGLSCYEILKINFFGNRNIFL